MGGARGARSPVFPTRLKPGQGRRYARIMRTALLANNRLGAAVGRYLAGRGELAGLVVHPEARRTCQAELDVLDITRLGMARRARCPVHPLWNIEFLFSVLFGYAGL